MTQTSNPLAVLLCVAGLLITACTAQGVYEGSHQWRADQCAKLPEHEHGECLREARKSYGEHKKEYDEASKDE